MSSWSRLNDVCVPTLTFEVIIKSCHSRSKSQEAIICMISLSVFQKFFGPLFILPGLLRWGFNTKFRADRMWCCGLGSQVSVPEELKQQSHGEQTCSEPYHTNPKWGECMLSWKAKLNLWAVIQKTRISKKGIWKSFLFRQIRGLDTFLSSLIGIH